MDQVQNKEVDHIKKKYNGNGTEDAKGKIFGLFKSEKDDDADEDDLIYEPIVKIEEKEDIDYSLQSLESLRKAKESTLHGPSTSTNKKTSEESQCETTKGSCDAAGNTNVREQHRADESSNPERTINCLLSSIGNPIPPPIGITTLTKLTEQLAKKSKSDKKRPYKCELCGKDFTQRAYLKRHMYMHSGERPFRCAECNQGFTQKSHWEEHLFIHSGERPYRCDYCDKDFNRRYALKNHLILHSGNRPFMCDYCDKGFTRRARLEEHLFSHSGEKPYTCDTCHMGFPSKYVLKKHLLDHSGEWPFKCEECNKGFTKMSVFKRHLIYHSGEKPYTCHVCCKAFTRGYALKKHLLLHSDDEII